MEIQNDEIKLMKKESSLTVNDAFDLKIKNLII